MNFSDYYRKLTEAERGDSPYKYELLRNYVQRDIDLGDKDTFVGKWVYYSAKRHTLFIRKGYRWDGPSFLAIDTPDFMRGSLVHDALYQLMREGKLSRSYRKYTDKLLVKICKEDGMPGWRRFYVYWFVRFFAGSAAKGEKK